MPDPGAFLTTGVRFDHTVILTAIGSAKVYPDALRRVTNNFTLFTAFVGLNLFQSAFTNWCPPMTILRKLHVREN
jgi:hypothetical protein